MPYKIEVDKTPFIVPGSDRRWIPKGQSAYGSARMRLNVVLKELGIGKHRDITELEAKRIKDVVEHAHSDMPIAVVEYAESGPVTRSSSSSASTATA